MNTVKRRKKQHAARKWKATLRELRNFASITEAALWRYLDWDETDDLRLTIVEKKRWPGFNRMNVLLSSFFHDEHCDTYFENFADLAANFDANDCTTSRTAIVALVQKHSELPGFRGSYGKRFCMLFKHQVPFSEQEKASLTKDQLLAIAETRHREYVPCKYGYVVPSTDSGNVHVNDKITLPYKWEGAPYTWDESSYTWKES